MIEIRRAGDRGRQVVSPGSAAEFAASIDEQAAHLAATAKVLGIKPKQ